MKPGVGRVESGAPKGLVGSAVLHLSGGGGGRGQGRNRCYFPFGSSISSPGPRSGRSGILSMTENCERLLSLRGRSEGYHVVRTSQWQCLED